MQVKGAIRTDFILSAEIMAIALASLEHLTLVTTALALIAVALAITAGVYGVVGLIVKLDDIGLHMAQRQSRLSRAVGDGWYRCSETAERARGDRHRGDAVGRRRNPPPRHGGAALGGPHSARGPRFSAAFGQRPVLWRLRHLARNALAGAVTGLVIGGIIVASSGASSSIRKN